MEKEDEVVELDADDVVTAAVVAVVVVHEGIGSGVAVFVNGDGESFAASINQG